jgi:endonuclease III related protein
MSVGSVLPLATLFRQLRGAYGLQGWWPVAGRAGTPGFDEGGYHPGLFDVPSRPEDRFEVIMGAILTQNTAWTNVESSLRALRAAGIRLPAHVLRRTEVELARLVRTSGFHNQKAARLVTAARFFGRRGILTGRVVPVRSELLALHGIGPETADAILLYAFREPVFVVDAYARRILSRVGLVDARLKYDELQYFFHAALRRDAELFSEFHALIVAHAKRHCRSTARCGGCPVSPCRYAGRPGA